MLLQGGAQRSILLGTPKVAGRPGGSHLSVGSV